MFSQETYATITREERRPEVPYVKVPRKNFAIDNVCEAMLTSFHLPHLALL
jgi:hypothetical protein